MDLVDEVDLVDGVDCVEVDSVNGVVVGPCLTRFLFHFFLLRDVFVQYTQEVLCHSRARRGVVHGAFVPVARLNPFTHKTPASTCLAECVQDPKQVVAKRFVVGCLNLVYFVCLLCLLYCAYLAYCAYFVYLFGRLSHHVSQRLEINSSPTQTRLRGFQPRILRPLFI